MNDWAWLILIWFILAAVATLAATRFSRKRRERL